VPQLPTRRSQLISKGAQVRVFARRPYLDQAEGNSE
jgi:hypothetical protein